MTIQVLRWVITLFYDDNENSDIMTSGLDEWMRELWIKIKEKNIYGDLGLNAQPFE